MTFYYTQNILKKKFLTRAVRLCRFWRGYLTFHWHLPIASPSCTVLFLILQTCQVLCSFKLLSVLSLGQEYSVGPWRSGLANSHSPFKSQHKCPFAMEVLSVLLSSPEDSGSSSFLTLSQQSVSAHLLSHLKQQTLFVICAINVYHVFLPERLRVSSAQGPCCSCSLFYIFSVFSTASCL